MRAATWDLVRRRVYLWTLTLSLAAAGVAAWLAGPEQAWSVVAGALIGFFNLASLARAVVRLVAEARADPQRSAGGAGLALVRWPVAALATVAVLWYMPGRPEGLSAGVLAALAAFCLAALQSRADLSSDDPEPDA